MLSKRPAIYGSDTYTFSLSPQTALSTCKKATLFHKGVAVPSAVASAIGPSPVMGSFVFPMSWILLMVGVNFDNSYLFFLGCILSNKFQVETYF